MVNEFKGLSDGVKLTSIIFAIASGVVGAVFGVGAFYSRMVAVEGKATDTERIVVVNSTRITRVEENLIHIRQGLDRIERKVEKRNP